MAVVKFQCIRSGNVVSFSNEDDIAGLRKHEGYREVIENGEKEVEQKASEEVLTKKRGRPKAAQVPSFLE